MTTNLFREWHDEDDSDQEIDPDNFEFKADEGGRQLRYLAERIAQGPHRESSIELSKLILDTYQANVEKKRARDRGTQTI